LRRRVGVYGGTFDPIHHGHLKVAEAVLKAFAMDRLVFVPAYIPPHKRREVISSPFHRLAMLALATANSQRMFVSYIELEAPAYSYTIETLERLQAASENAQLFFVMGADSFKEITTWHEYERILTEYDCIVAARPDPPDPPDPEDGHLEGQQRAEDMADHLAPHLRVRVIDLCGGRLPPNEPLSTPHIYLTDYTQVDVSATNIRERAAQGRPLDDLVPHAVATYIEKYKLYQKQEYQ
jgi:nicotinate-nucleotide adenylyltransferase